MKHISFIYILLLLFFFSCTSLKEKQYDVSLNEDNFISINPNDDTPYAIELLYDGLLIKSDSLKGNVNRNLLSFINTSDQINNIALKAVQSNNKIPVSLKIGTSLDTTFTITINPLPMDTLKLSIEGNCAKLISTFDKNSDESSLKRWLFQKKNPLADKEFQTFVGLVRRISAINSNSISINGNIPKIKTLPSYTINGTVDGDYFAILACSSDKEVTKFVEDCIANNFSYAKSSLEQPLSCYKIGNPNGFQSICLIVINKDWSYKAFPLGAVMIDNVPPIILNNTNINTEDDYDNLLKKQYNANFSDIILNNGTCTIIIPENRPKIAGTFSIRIGQFEGSMYALSMPFTVQFTSDIHNVTLKEPQRETEVASVLLQEKESPYSFRATFRSMEYGDNYIPVIITDDMGNTSSFKYKQNCVKVEDKSNNINIDNNVNVW